MSSQVAAIVAAAGRSRRMGSCKQLLDLGGKTVLARCLETLLAGGMKGIIVVVGTLGEAVAVEARRYPVRIAINNDHQGDMASSVRAGYAALLPETSGVIVALGDYPLVASSTISDLVAAHADHPAAIIVPVHDGRRGHPTLFPLAALDELKEGITLRDLVRRDPSRLRLLDVDDPGILQDMDTPGDYQLMQRLIRNP
jgi:molybdenum cofactor cytidylyltransferase